MLIAQEAYDFIVRQEVTSPKYYEQHYRRPEWPGASSGITIGCGYDLGYASPDKIEADWSHLVSADMLAVMVHCSGVKGAEAKSLLPSVRNEIDIPWEAAEEVFKNRDIPQWTAAVQRCLPNCDRVSPLCLGMHVATAYNRGIEGYVSASPRFTEMHNIFNDMASKNFADISSQFRSMQRLWPNMRGLRDRYAETADLWDKGMKQPLDVATARPPVRPDSETPLSAGPARTRPPATSSSQNSATGGIVVGTATAASHAASSGLPAHVVTAIVVFGLIAAVATWTLWYRHRNPV